jgi:hypothetical protein
MEKQPLSVMLENAKGMTYQAFNQVQEKTQLPAYLMEGIIMEILADIRNQKNLELVSDFNRMQESQESQKERKVEE